MKIDVSYDELLDIANALKARADIFERMPAPLDPAQRHLWQGEAAYHRELADKLLAQASDGRPGTRRRRSVTEPKADQTRWTLVLCRFDPSMHDSALRPRKMILFATKQEAETELAKVQERGEPAYILSPIEAWDGKP